MLRSLLLATATLIASVSAQTDAKTFRVVTQGASKIIAVQSPKDASKRSIFVLAPAGTQRLSNVTVAGALGSSVMAEAVRYFTTPLQRVAVLANTHLPWFDVRTPSCPLCLRAHEWRTVLPAYESGRKRVDALCSPARPHATYSPLPPSP